MTQLFTFLFVLTLVLGLSMQSHAVLEVRGEGTSVYGTYRLIYDTDFNITWYNYTKSQDTWYNQVNWASELTVDFGGLVYNDWQLPSTVDGPWSSGYDGTTTVGYNIASSEMGHLYYTELGNNGYYDKSGNPTGCSSSSPWCLTNKGDFQNLQPVYYWSDTEYSALTTNAWIFSTFDGAQAPSNKDHSYYALAVRQDDVTVVPEPISAILFVTGGILLTGRRLMKQITISWT